MPKKRPLECKVTEFHAEWADIESAAEELRSRRRARHLPTIALVHLLADVDRVLGEASELGRLSGVYLASANDEEPKRSRRTVGREDLDWVLGMEAGDHAAALELLAKFGDSYYPGRPPLEVERLKLSGDSELRWPQYLWGDILGLKRAAWLHRLLLEKSGVELDALLGPKQFDEDDLDDPDPDGGSPDYKCTVEWPNHLRLSWVPLPYSWQSDAADAKTFLWEYLLGSINDGLNRHRVQNQLRFNRLRNSIYVESGHTFFGALWELVSLDVLHTPIPRSCVVCGAPLNSQRTTRLYCDRVRCRRAAQRARERSRTDSDV